VPGVETISAVANGVRFACLADGPVGGPLALLLHGFPDTAHTWRHLIPELAGAGYRVVAPFMRGYAPTELAPDGRYQTGVLALDACRIHEALEATGDAVVVGHDWGAFAAYGAAALEPDRWRRVVAMAVPHPAALASGFLSYDQLKRSWYVFFFQMPFAESVLSADDMAFIARLWADWSPGYDAAWDLERVRESLGSPGRLAAAIEYYRARLDPSRHDPALAEAEAACLAPTPRPTLYLHGRDDGCMAASLAAGIDAVLAPGSRVELVEAAGHFLHLERPTVINRLVLEFLAA
jgi:pimeloyl-ACP methyl ester carboxylesterase